MSYEEEQEMEAEALLAIFDTAFQDTSSSSSDANKQWEVTLFPIDCDDEDESDSVNHVGIKLCVDVPGEYPEILPNLDVEILKGLAEEQRQQILTIAKTEAESYLGMPAIYAVCEAIRAWLVDHNVKGLDDQSMHAQMMRRQKEKELEEAQVVQRFESQQELEKITEAELEEQAVRRRREEGTPCTVENFLEWAERFAQEMEEKRAKEEEERKKNEKTSKKKGSSNAANINDEMEKRMTGFEFFTQKGATSNMDALEKAVEEAAAQEGDDDDDDVDIDDLEVDEDLFDDDDDLDDMDFDSDEDDEFDDDDEEVDI